MRRIAVHGCPALFVVFLLLAGACTHLEKYLPSQSKEVRDAVPRTVRTTDDAGPVESAGLSEQSQNRLRVIENIMEECPLDTPPFDLSSQTVTGARQALYQCETRSERVNNTLGRIAAEDQMHPRYVRAAAYGAGLTEKVVAWKEEIDAHAEAAGEARQTSSALARDLQRHQNILVLLHKLDEATDVRAPQYPEHLRDSIARAQALDEFHESCQDEYAGVTVSARRPAEDPEVACDLAGRWREILPAYLALTLEHFVTRQTEIYAQWMSELESDGVLTENRRVALSNPQAEMDRLFGLFEPAYESLGLDLSKDEFGSIGQAASDFGRRLTAAARANRWPRGATHREAPFGQYAQHVSQQAELSLLRWGLTHPNWSVRTGDDNVPTHRVRDMAVLTRATGESHCRVYISTARANYDRRAGGFLDTEPGTIYSPTTRYQVTRCP